MNLKFDEEPKYQAFMAIFDPLCGPNPQRPILTEGQTKVHPVVVYICHSPNFTSVQACQISMLQCFGLCKMPDQGSMKGMRVISPRFQHQATAVQAERLVSTVHLCL